MRHSGYVTTWRYDVQPEGRELAEDVGLWGYLSSPISTLNP